MIPGLPMARRGLRPPTSPEFGPAAESERTLRVTWSLPPGEGRSPLRSSLFQFSSGAENGVLKGHTVRNTKLFSGVVLGVLGATLAWGGLFTSGCQYPTSSDMNLAVDRALKDANTDSAAMTGAQTTTLMEDHQTIVESVKTVSEQMTEEHTIQTPEQEEELNAVFMTALQSLETQLTGMQERQSNFSEWIGEWKGSREQLAELEALVEQGKTEGMDLSWAEGLLALLGVGTGSTVISRVLGSGSKVSELEKKFSNLQYASAFAAPAGQRFPGDTGSPAPIVPPGGQL